jgi:UDP-galactopyranose mutase
MWDTDVDETILDRVPLRKDNSNLYFPKDTYQFLPENGYTKLFENIFDHPNITVKLSTSFAKELEKDFYHVFNSMPIDEYYDFQFGELMYRSIKFTDVHVPCPKIFNQSVVNFTHNGPETRVVEWKNFPNHGDNDSITTLTYETPCDYKDNYFERYYPVKDKFGYNKSIYEKYKNIKNDKVTFIGRCGLYAYLDMHQAISSSLSVVKSFLKA